MRTLKRVGGRYFLRIDGQVIPVDSLEMALKFVLYDFELKKCLTK